MTHIRLLSNILVSVHTNWTELLFWFFLCNYYTKVIWISHFSFLSTCRIGTNQVQKALIVGKIFMIRDILTALSLTPPSITWRTRVTSPLDAITAISNKWVATNRILTFVYRFLGSPQGKHCNSLERNVRRRVVRTSKETILEGDNRFFAAALS